MRRFPGERWDDFTVPALNRPLDMSFVLDRLLEKNAASATSSRASSTLRSSRPSGWSYGGYARNGPRGWSGQPRQGHGRAGVLRAAGDIRSDSRRSENQGHRPLDGSSWVMHFYELARVSVPSMGVGEEWSMLKEQIGDPFTSWQARQHAAFQSHPNYRVDVTGAWHVSFSNLWRGLQPGHRQRATHRPGLASGVS